MKNKYFLLITLLLKLSTVIAGKITSNTIIIRNSTGFPLGYEYEMLRLFADENDLALNVKIIENIENEDVEQTPAQEAEAQNDTPAEDALEGSELAQTVERFGKIFWCGATSFFPDQTFHRKSRKNQ